MSNLVRKKWIWVPDFWVVGVEKNRSLFSIVFRIFFKKNKLNIEIGFRKMTESYLTPDFGRNRSETDSGIGFNSNHDRVGIEK